MPRKSSGILIVSDEPDTRIFLANLLNAEGFRPAVADSETEGLKLTLDKHPAVIIIDMMMPKEGSIHMYRFLKQHDRLKRIPVIMLSSIDRERFFKYRRIRTTEAGSGAPPPEAYLEKPFDTEILLKLVRKLSGVPEKTNAEPAGSAGIHKKGKRDRMEA